MSKIFIISNTQFNNSKKLSIKEWLKNMDYYFNNEFIPYLNENKSDNNILIHLGNLTSKSKSINLEVLKFVQEIFYKLGSMLPTYILTGDNDVLSINILKYIKNVEIIKEPKEIEILLEQKFAMLPYNTKIEDIDKFDSDYCFFNFDVNTQQRNLIINKLSKFKKCYCGYYDKNGVIKNIKFLGAPYNLNKDDKKGIIVLETYDNKDKFILNKVSPSFKEIVINKEEDLDIDKELLNNNYVKLILNKKLLIDNKLKIDMLLSNGDFMGISYIEDDIDEHDDVIKIDGENVLLKDMVKDFIVKSDMENKVELLNEFEKIIKIKNA